MKESSTFMQPRSQSTQNPSHLHLLTYPPSQLLFCKEPGKLKLFAQKASSLRLSVDGMTAMTSNVAVSLSPCIVSGKKKEEKLRYNLIMSHFGDWTAIGWKREAGSSGKEDPFSVVNTSSMKER